MSVMRNLIVAAVAAALVLGGCSTTKHRYVPTLYGTDPSDLGGRRATTETWLYLGLLQNGTQYYVALEAVDAAGRTEPFDTAAPYMWAAFQILGDWR